MCFFVGVFPNPPTGSVGESRVMQQHAPGNVIIHLVLNRLNDAKVKLKMARTDYTQEDTKDVVERIRKG